MKKTDLAWAAGFLDGEGYFQSTKTEYVFRKDGKGTRIKSYSYFKINVAQSDPRVLKKLNRIVGEGRVTGPYRHKNSNQLPYYVYAVCTRAEEFFKKIYPYLGSVKRTQGLLALRKSKKENHKLRRTAHGKNC